MMQRRSGENSKGRAVAFGLAIAMAPLAGLAQSGAESAGERETEYDPGDLFGNPSMANPYDRVEYYGEYWDNLSWYESYEADDGFGAGFEWDEQNQSWEQSAAADQDSGDYRLREVYPNPESARSPLGDTDALSGQQASSEQGEEDMVTLTGVVDGFRRAVVAGAPGYRHERALARLSLDDGRRAVVDLGLMDTLEVELRQGDRIALKGTRGTLSGQNVVVARELETPFGVVRIEEGIVAAGQPELATGDPQELQSSSAETAQASSVTIEGRVEVVEEVQPEGAEDPQTWIRLRFQDGAATMVNLGPNTRLEELAIEEGDRVEVQGHLSQREGRSIVEARRIRVEGETVAEPSGV